MLGCIRRWEEVRDMVRLNTLVSCVDVPRILQTAQHFDISPFLGASKPTFHLLQSPQQCFGLWSHVFASTTMTPIHAPFSRNVLKPLIHQCNRLNVCTYLSSILNMSRCHVLAYHSVFSCYLISPITKSHGLTGSDVLNTRCILE